MNFSAGDIDALMGNIAKILATDTCEWFFDFESSRWACLIGSDVLLFSREEEDSITVQYQNSRLLFLRDTDGWDVVSDKLYGYEKTSPEDLPHGDPAYERSQANIRMRVLEAFAQRVAKRG